MSEHTAESSLLRQKQSHSNLVKSVKEETPECHPASNPGGRLEVTFPKLRNIQSALCSTYQVGERKNGHTLSV